MLETVKVIPHRVTRNDCQLNRFRQKKARKSSLIKKITRNNIKRIINENHESIMKFEDECNLFHENFVYQCSGL